MNEQKNMDLLIEKLVKENKRPKLFLHCCCAPCASYVFEYLTPYFDITAFFYNPNITNEQEYSKRLEELIRLAKHYNVKIANTNYNNLEFFNSVKGYEKEPEGGKRCEICFDLRLSKTAENAKGYDYFATTLTISPLKNAELINTIGNKISKDCGIEYLASNFKKKNGYKRSIELSKIYNLYRQDYCGCIYSQINKKQKDVK